MVECLSAGRWIPEKCLRQSSLRARAEKTGKYAREDVLHGMFYMECFTWNVLHGMFYMRCFTWNVLHGMFICLCDSPESTFI